MKTIIGVIMFLMMTVLSYANDIYVTQSGNALDLDITQDGENNTVGNSTTASASAGVTTILNIDPRVPAKLWGTFSVVFVELRCVS